jgi:hypothetical protein
LNYWELGNRSVEYLASLRDRNVDLIGVRTKIRRPDRENPVSFYGDYLSSYLPEEDISLVPQYSKYYQVIDILGQMVEVNLPLQAVVKVKDYIPNDSVVLIAVRNNEGTTQSRWWRVLSTEVKHIDNHYSRIAYLAPVREKIGIDGEVKIRFGTKVTANAT